MQHYLISRTRPDNKSLVAYGNIYKEVEVGGEQEVGETVALQGSRVLLDLMGEGPSYPFFVGVGLLGIYTTAGI